MDNRRNLLITLADNNYIQQAKQLFSSVYWNAGWDGDYMLLAHDIHDEELQWFRDKGILIKNCKSLYYESIIQDQHSPIILDKLYIFSPEFKKWGNIIFLDSDMIVRGSLDRLTKIKGFGAVSSDINLARQFSVDGNLYNEIKTRYNLNKRSFNTGLLAFSTDIIQDNLLDTFIELFDYYGNTLLCNEESVLNLFFYKKWIRLPRVYNLYISYLLLYKIRCNKIQTIVLHFIRVLGYEKYKPWNPQNPFYSEWTSNFEKAELIDLNSVQKVKKWKSHKILFYSLLFDLYNLYILHSKLINKFFDNLRKVVIFVASLPDKIIGLIGNLIKKISPDLHHKIKSMLGLEKPPNFSSNFKQDKKMNKQ